MKEIGSLALVSKHPHCALDDGTTTRAHKAALMKEGINLRLPRPQKKASMWPRVVLWVGILVLVAGTARFLWRAGWL